MQGASGPDLTPAATAPAAAPAIPAGAAGEAPPAAPPPPAADAADAPPAPAVADAPSAPPDPAPQRPRGERRVAAWSPRFAVAAVVAGLVAALALAALPQVAAGGADAPAWIAAVSLLVADAVLLVAVVVAARRGTERLGAATLGLRRTAFGPALGWALAGWVAVSAVNGLWALLVTGGEQPEGGGEPALDESGALVLALVVLGVAVTAPIAEEIAFRGYLFAALTRWRGPWPAAIVTGVLFGLAHLTVYPLEFIPPLAFIGFVLCLVFWFTGSLLPGIGLHALNNALVTGVLLGWSWQVPLLVLGSVVVAVALCWPVARRGAAQHA